MSIAGVHIKVKASNDQEIAQSEGNSKYQGG